ncbi:MAG: protein kinase, partial [Myxococcaceae bacterium]|nr:protein kinase [Myxococcaceae bacterium]
MKRLHVGGLAEVYLAVAGAKGFEQAVAIKKLLSAAAHDEEFLTIFLDEARISVQLSHPNIVHVLEVGSEDETYFLAMEFVAGRTLADLAARLRPDDLALRVPLAAFVVSKIAEGLDSASRCTDGQGVELNIVHRAVSPGNVLVSYSGEVKLLDFGTARASNRAQHTQVGMLKGKLGYLSPEQLRGAEHLDRRADLFAAGVVLHELLTGERLFPDGSILQSLERLNDRQVPPPSQKNPHVPPELDAVVARALADQPDERFQWGRELSAALGPFITGAVRSSAELASLLKDRFAAEFVSDQELLRRALASPGPALPEPRLSAPGRPRPQAVTPGEPEPRLSAPSRPPSRTALPRVESDATRAAFPVLAAGETTSPGSAAAPGRAPSRSSLPPVAAPRATPARPASR